MSIGYAYRCRARLSVVLLLCAASVTAPAADIVFGGESSFTLTVLASERLPGLIEPVSAAVLSPRLSVYGSSAELTVRGALGLAAVQPAALLDLDTVFAIDPSVLALMERTGTVPLVSLSELRLTLFPADALRVDVGRFTHNPGYALLSSPNRHFGSAGAALLTGAFAGSSGGFADTPATLAAVTGFLGNGFGRLVVAPSPDTPSLPPVPGTWLPDVGIPESIDVPELNPDQPIILQDVIVEPTERLLSGYKRVSASVEAGVSTILGTAGIIYFHGIDRDPVLRSRLDFNRSTLPTRFDFVVDPLEAVVDVLGLVAETGAGAFTFWMDGAFTFNKTVAKREEVDSLSRRTVLEKVPTIEATAGASYQRDRALFLAEYAYVHSFTQSPLVRLTVPHLTLVAVRAQSRSGVLRAELGAALSPTDLSAGVYASGAIQPSDELSVTLSVPVVLGAAESFFGQYSNVLAARLSLSYRF